MSQEITTMHHSETHIREFVIRRAAYYLDVPESIVEPERPLGDYGVDSVYLLSIVSDLEEHLDVELDLEALSEVRTVAQLAARVAPMVPEMPDVPA